MLDISPEKIAVFRKTAQRRRERERGEIERRKEKAWAAARRAATLLKEQFCATRVVVFGSLVHDGCFTRWSDVDIAAWGIAPEETFRAIGAVMDMESPLDVNLVDVSTCRPSILEMIKEEGVDL
ncbi:MAG: nucleotidyltransferase domain-containing protein [Anaerolineales bacterium]|nr:nucleotidyltransferase domain-containing protein [Anaerolineales bacterium]